MIQLYFYQKPAVLILGVTHTSLPRNTGFFQPSCSPQDSLPWVFSELWGRCSFICIPGFLMGHHICFQGFVLIAPSLSTLSPKVIRNRAVTRNLFKQTTPGERPSYTHITCGERSGLYQILSSFGERLLFPGEVYRKQLIQFEKAYSFKSSFLKSSFNFIFFFRNKLFLRLEILALQTTTAEHWRAAGWGGESSSMAESLSSSHA